jgi:ankyrin repeat protein
MVPGLDMLYTLLKLAGADVTATNHAGETPLHCAVAQGDLNLMRMLLLDACDVNAQRKDGSTAAHLAAAHADPETRMGLVRSLVKSNASLTTANFAGEVPIEVARRSPDPHAVVVRCCLS